MREPLRRSGWRSRRQGLVATWICFKYVALSCIILWRPVRLCLCGCAQRTVNTHTHTLISYILVFKDRWTGWVLIKRPRSSRHSNPEFNLINKKSACKLGRNSSTKEKSGAATLTSLFSPPCPLAGWELLEFRLCVWASGSSAWSGPSYVVLSHAGKCRPSRAPTLWRLR